MGKSLTDTMKPEETKAPILSVCRKTEYWEDGGKKHYSKELALYTLGFYMQFSLKDSRLPEDIETNYKNYLLCTRRFEPDKPMSNTGLTSVWLERR